MALKIPWEYCECGCHCHVAKIGGLYFSFYNDLRGSLTLAETHHPYLSSFAEKFKSMRGVDAAVRRRLAQQKKVLRQQMQQLADLV